MSEKYPKQNGNIEKPDWLTEAEEDFLITENKPETNRHQPLEINKSMPSNQTNETGPEKPAIGLEVKKPKHTSLSTWAKNELAAFHYQVREDERHNRFLEYLDTHAEETIPDIDDAINIVESRIQALTIAQESPHFPEMFNNTQLEELLVEYITLSEVLTISKEVEENKHEYPRLQLLNDLLYKLFEARKDTFGTKDYAHLNNVDSSVEKE